MIYCLDLDGTLCTIAERSDDMPAYDEALPLRHRIALVNKLHYEGHRIIIFTARGSGTGIDWSELTKRQLREWHVQYHELCFEKPHYDVYVGDKAFNDRAFFGSIDNRSFEQF